MKMHAESKIAASPERVWEVVSDIEHADQFISGITDIEVLSRPEQGLQGLVWRETRLMFGKTASETMEVTQVEEGKAYHTKAASHGAEYHAVIRVLPEGEQTRLTMEFEALPQTWVAKIMTLLMGFMIKKATLQAFQQDLLDIKHYIERQVSQS